MNPKPRIIFLGTPEFAATVLAEILLEHNQEVVLEAVFSRPDAPQGRGQHLTPCPVKTLAISAGIPVFTPDTKAELASEIEAINPDLVVVVAYGMIIPKSITDAYFCMNIHGSILPKYRGAAPIHAALLNGDTETGITLIKMNEALDAGNMLSIHRYPIAEHDNFKTLHDGLAELSVAAWKTFIASFKAQCLIEIPQNDAESSYAAKLSKSDSELLKTDSPQVLLGKIRAFSPTPGAWTWAEGKRIKVLSAQLNKDHLTVLTVKPEGKKEMSYHDYCLNHPPLFFEETTPC
ncbi:MAG: methionyl-tRNA formyltransferase [Candidatus Margulisiibacteriota bacterium]